MCKALATGNAQLEQTLPWDPWRDGEWLHRRRGCSGLSFSVTPELFTLNLVHIKKQKFASFVQTSYILISVYKLKALHTLKCKFKWWLLMCELGNPKAVRELFRKTRRKGIIWSKSNKSKGNTHTDITFEAFKAKLQEWLIHLALGN